MFINCILLRQHSQTKKRNKRQLLLSRIRSFHPVRRLCHSRVPPVVWVSACQRGISVSFYPNSKPMAWDHSGLGQVSILLLTYPPGSVGSPLPPRRNTVCVPHNPIRLTPTVYKAEFRAHPLCPLCWMSSQVSVLELTGILRPSSNAHPLVLVYPCPSPHNTQATLLVINWILPLVHLQKPWHTTSTPHCHNPVPLCLETASMKKPWGRGHLSANHITPHACIEDTKRSHLSANWR